jgi:CubicO group peptidase (beta-lactamase class C family)
MAIPFVSLMLPLLCFRLTGTALRATPAMVGRSKVRIRRVSDTIAKHIAARTTRGAVVAIARHGRVVHLEAQGVMDIESKTPMATGSIFHIMSMTKPVVAVAVLMLMEEGKLQLSDPVSRFIPEFARLQVAVPRPGGREDRTRRFDIVPANRPVTLRDLLTHTSGLMSGPVSIREAERLASPGPADALRDVVPRFAKVPLEFQPGKRWAYSPTGGFDTLLRVVEIASGEPADRWMRRRIFEPLGMKDTGFWTDDSSRLVPLYEPQPQGLRRVTYQYGPSKPRYFSGGAGLVSTAEDYMQFGQMLLNGGEWNGVRLLSRRAVALMRADLVHQFDSPVDGLKAGRTFGLGVQTVTDPAAAGYRVGPGTFGWDGGYESMATHFWADPTGHILGVVMLQGPDVQLFRDIESAVMQAGV